jgi:hypothetical protein|tara:strand:+ start:233 stop:712 length:480 start_codon:yes stop_codon:yes gene_type:complete
MLAETLAGIALVKSAVDGIKSAIGTAKDVGEIAGHIDNLLTGEKQVQEQRSRKSGVSLGDQFGIKSVAQEVIDARLAQESLNEMRTLVDLRFGPGTWQSIVDERARRIQQAKEAARAARIKARREQEEFIEGLKQSALVSLVIAIAAGLFFAFLVFLPK